MNFMVEFATNRWTLYRLNFIYYCFSWEKLNLDWFWQGVRAEPIPPSPQPDRPCPRMPPNDQIKQDAALCTIKENRKIRGPSIWEQKYYSLCWNKMMGSRDLSSPPPNSKVPSPPSPAKSTPPQKKIFFWYVTEVYKMKKSWKMGEKWIKKQFSIEIFACKF